MNALRAIRESLSANKLDAFFVTDPVNASYLSGIPAIESSLLVTSRASFLFTDPRHKEDALNQARGLRVIILKGGSRSSLITRLGKYHRIGFEARGMSYYSYAALKKELKDARLVPVAGLVEEQRIIKDASEIKLLRASASIAARAVKFAGTLAKIGATERQIAAALEHKINKLGGAGPSFSTIVASGPNSSRPHAELTDRKIRGNEPVLIDAGCDFKGYKSDLTRVFFSGKINDFCRKIYGIVLRAQDAAIRKVAPGVKIGEIDRAARRVIAAHGYGRNFLHATGHGIGRQVHEQPRISIKNQDTLKPGMVFTVEPAIYFPGRFGIRIEDMVLVTAKGCEVLTDDIDKSI